MKSTLPEVEEKRALAYGVALTKGRRSLAPYTICDEKGHSQILLLTPGNSHDNYSSSKIGIYHQRHVAEPMFCNWDWQRAANRFERPSKISEPRSLSQP